MLAHRTIGITDHERANTLAQANLTPLTDDLVRAAMRACSPRHVKAASRGRPGRLIRGR